MKTTFSIIRLIDLMRAKKKYVNEINYNSHWKQKTL